MRRKKEDYVVLAIALTLVGVVFGIIYMLLSSTKQPVKKGLEQPTPIPTPVISLDPTSVPVLVKMGEGNMLYNQSDGDKLTDLAQNRRQLADNDIRAKDKILEGLFAVEPSGYVYQSENVKIEYINPRDEFVVEITTLDVDKAKREAFDWFILRGMSHDGICNMPITFYLNYNVAESLKNSNVVFSPLALGCD